MGLLKKKGEKNESLNSIAQLSREYAIVCMRKDAVIDRLKVWSLHNNSIESFSLVHVRLNVACGVTGQTVRVLGVPEMPFSLIK